ncbi:MULTISPECIES: type 1 glutamine amidotransferase [Prochlorococcus]|uniref:type 1 glutamine amidotransferase n=1 Tax=Prochlorococcus TaxID=1218 RepID=UPI00053395A2|nr:MULTISPECIES: type 1 glutamine amidotransferase [Prochlorococcus]KGG11899.1 glutamine amidotransferase class-I [Prochlorococcus sp. MIT 0601]
MSRLLIIQHLERENAGLFLEVARERGMDICISRVDLGHELPSPEKGDLLLLLGGPMGIKDLNNPSYPWLRKELNLIKQYLNNNDIRILGVCLGAQLLAFAAGGDVVPLLSKETGSKPFHELGWGPISLRESQENKAFNDFLDKPLYALHWHGDRIILPPSATLLASSAICTEQVFSISQNNYGFQCHFEITEEMVNTWIEQDRNFIEVALGVQGQEILYNSQKIYGAISHQSRLGFIRKTFHLLYQ